MLKNSRKVRKKFSENPKKNSLKYRKRILRKSEKKFSEK